MDNIFNFYNNGGAMRGYLERKLQEKERQSATYNS